jgi:TolB-like protein
MNITQFTVRTVKLFWFFSPANLLRQIGETELMARQEKAGIKIDLDQFKLHICIENDIELSLHFDSPSRKFYLSVIALVANQMQKQGKIASILLEPHYDLLALLNETVGGSAGSSRRENLLPRIYKKWKAALPNLEEAPLFKVLGRKKEYGDGAGRTYRLSERERDIWANLFEYKGSGENVRLRFSVDKLGANLNDVVITYGGSQSLEDASAWDRFITTLKRSGEDRAIASDEYSVLTEPRATISSSRKSIWLRLSQPQKTALLVSVASLILALFLTAIWYSNSPHVPQSLEHVYPDKISIAVLPFENIGGNPEQEYIAAGITDNIITALSKVPEMLVIARNSVITYKGKPVNIRQVSEELGARYVLEGSVQKEGDRLRINAQLIDATQSHHIWAERYDRELKDLFALQDEITIKVLTELRVKLTKGLRSKIYTKGTENLEAYFKAMKALEHLQRFTKNDNRLAQQTAKEIITMDPMWPNGYILLGWTHFMDARGGYGNSPKESLLRAEELARKALELDDSLSTPHLILGKIHYLRRHWDKAIAEIELAVSISPTNIEAIYHYARTLMYAGRPEESILLYKKAMLLDPLYPALVNLGLGTAYFDSGQYEDAIVQFQRLLDRSKKPEQPHSFLAATYAILGRMEKARKHAEEALKINPEFSFERYVKRMPYKNEADKKLWIDALRKAGLK